ncbi:extensin-like [Selaginella moellendorffii]|uniref:extensin-like n=1 Tax=Selaginella moellendorffii TaxID=88036 RepID=UPI000D1CA941|nr:extensin-like [Selaginella moellendorffii]|eukprot:XP_024523601.1 extensin-like [Selaginella moellendorffii]
MVFDVGASFYPRPWRIVRRKEGMIIPVSCVVIDLPPPRRAHPQQAPVHSPQQEGGRPTASSPVPRGTRSLLPPLPGPVGLEPRSHGEGFRPVYPAKPARGPTHLQSTPDHGVNWRGGTTDRRAPRPVVHGRPPKAEPCPVPLRGYRSGRPKKASGHPSVVFLLTDPTRRAVCHPVVGFRLLLATSPTALVGFAAFLPSSPSRSAEFLLACRPTPTHCTPPRLCGAQRSPRPEEEEPPSPRGRGRPPLRPTAAPQTPASSSSSSFFAAPHRPLLFCPGLLTPWGPPLVPGVGGAAGWWRDQDRYRYRSPRPAGSVVRPCWPCPLSHCPVERAVPSSVRSPRPVGDEDRRDSLCRRPVGHSGPPFGTGSTLPRAVCWSFRSASGTSVRDTVVRRGSAGVCVPDSHQNEPLLQRRIVDRPPHPYPRSPQYTPTRNTAADDSTFELDWGGGVVDTVLSVGAHTPKTGKKRGGRGVCR